MVMLGALLLCPGQVVRAQSSKARPSVLYQAHATCPEQSQFIERMHARMLADRTRVPENVTLRVALVERGASTYGSLEIRRGTTRSQRNVAAARCEEVVEALALIAALALREQSDSDARAKASARKDDKASAAQQAPVRDASGTSAPRPNGANRERSAPALEQPAPPPTSSAAAIPSTEPPGTPRERTAEPARPSTPPPPANNPSASTERGAPRERTAEPAPQGATLAEDTTGRPGADAPAAPRDDAAQGVQRARVETTSAASEPGEAPQLEVSVGAAALLFSGLAPSLQPGLQLQAAVALEAFSLQLGVRIARPERVAAEGGEARLGFTAGFVRLCASAVPGHFALTACAVAEPGVFSARGENTLHARSHSRFWLATGVAAELGWRAASWLWLRSGAALLAPFRRDRVSLGGDTLYRIPVLGLRLHLGLELPFE